MEPELCVYLGQRQQDKLAPNGRPLRDCRLHGRCTRDGPPDRVASCAACADRLPLAARGFASRFRDGLRVFAPLDGPRAAWRPTAALRGLLRGGAAFLVCGGPSARDLPLARLAERGVFSLAVNNAAGFGPAPSAFVCADPPSKFCDGIWLDPAVMKFVPTPKLRGRRGRLRRKLAAPRKIKCRGPKSRGCPGGDCPACRGTGEAEEWFERLAVDGEEVLACDCPNVWGFERRSWMRPDDSFFLEASAAWGNHQSGVRQTGEEKTVCTMLLGLRILYHLGARTVFLVGVDFGMDPSRGPLGNYSFDEDRNAGACDNNNRQFGVVNGWLCRMRDAGVFGRFGLRVLNCNRESGLRAFPFVPFEVAIMEARRRLPPEPFDLNGWYAK